MSTAPIHAASREALRTVSLDKAMEDQIAELLARYPTKRAALLPSLWLCQERYGWIAPGVIETIAARLDLSPATVEGVVTFYTMFHTVPPARYVLQVCTTLSCAVCGAHEILAHLKERLGLAPGERTPDGVFQLIGVQCLGACGTAPVVQVNDDYYENLDRAKLDALITELQGAKE